MDLVASELVTGYRAHRQTTVVTRASFTVEARTVVALIGPNGSGKTTLLRSLAGLLPTLSGSVTIGGVTHVEYRRLFGIGYLPEGLFLPGAWTARGMLALTALAGGRAGANAMPRALEIAGVDFDLGQPLGQMSKGMRQRVALAMTLLPLPKLLLLDEPEAGLDPGQRIRLRERVRQFVQDGPMVIVASHDVSGICSMADRTYMMREQSLQPVDRAMLSDPARVIELFDRRNEA